MILCLPGGRVTFFFANILMVLRTVSMPLERGEESSRVTLMEKFTCRQPPNAPIVRGVGLQHGLPIRRTQQCACQTENARGLADTGWALSNREHQWASGVNQSNPHKGLTAIMRFGMLPSLAMT